MQYPQGRRAGGRAESVFAGKLERHPQREGHDREARIEAAARYEGRAVREVEVVEVVRAPPRVGDRCLRVVTHPARSEDVSRLGEAGDGPAGGVQEKEWKKGPCDRARRGAA